jgi:hypothetical protein
LLLDRTDTHVAAPEEEQFHRVIDGALEVRLEAEQPFAGSRSCLPSMRQDGRRLAGFRGFDPQLGPAQGGLPQQQVV